MPERCHAPNSCEFRMTPRNQQVLDEEMLLVLKVSSAEVSCSLSLFVKWMSSYLVGANTDACLCAHASASVCILWRA